MLNASPRLLSVATALATVVVLPALVTPASSAARSAAVSGWPVPPGPVTLRIDTAGKAPITSRDTYVAGTMRLKGTTYKLQIKGRGHSTWVWPKKPYRFKLAKAASILGIPAENDWVLLANYADRASLRNYLALSFARRTSLAWAPRSRFVDLVLNGSRRGTYLLTEQVEQSPKRVSLPSNGLLLEVDERYASQGDPGFRTANGIPIAFNDPDTLTAAQQAQVRGAVASFEKALYGPSFANPTTGYRAYVNVGSFVDWYLVNELFKNVDSDFYSSVYVTWRPGGRFAMGPPWDFDRAAGFRSLEGPTTTDPRGWWVRAGEVGKHPNHATHWIARMFQDPAFVAQVRSRWAQLRPAVNGMVAGIPAAAAALKPSVTNDWRIWHSGGGQVAGGVHARTFAGEVSYLQRWMRTRAAWMSSRKVGWRSAARTVSESAGVVRLPVTIGGSARVPASVHYAVTGGTAKNGADYTLAPGTLTFTGGHTTLHIPVTIRNDALREGAETIRIGLGSPSAGLLLGTQRTATLTIRASD